MNSSITPRTLRSRLLLVAAAAIVPVALAAAVGLSLVVRERLREAERKSMEVARLSAAAVDIELSRALAILKALAQSPALEDGDLRAFHGLMTRVLDTVPAWDSLRLSHPDGKTLLHAGQTAAASDDKPLELDSFVALARDRKPIIGYLRRDAVGNWSVPVRVPVVRAGQLRYILSARVSAAAIRQVLDRQRLPHDWIAAVYDAALSRVARSREHERFVGGVPTPSLVELLRDGHSEGTGVARTLENRAVYTAYVRLPQSQWIMVIGIPNPSLQANALVVFGLYGGGLLASLAVAFAAALYAARRISRPMAQLRLAAQQLGNGKVPEAPRSDIREVQDVARALVAAAQAKQDADRRKDEFLAVLAHELRNPLAPIRQATVISRAASATEAQKRWSLDVIDRQVQQMALLLDDLLDVSRITRGDFQLRKAPVELQAVLNAAIETARPHLEAKHLQLELAVAAEPVRMEADPLRVAQIVTNLLTNAARYTPQDGSVRVRANAEGGHAVVEVEDTGIGIARDDLEAIFGMFSQVGSRESRVAGGLGIGLALSRGIAALHGGTLTAASEGRGQGSRFTLRLPLGYVDAARGRRQESLVPRPENEAPRRLLVADDNRDAAESLAELLRLRGHEVTVAFDGAEALDAFRRTRPDAVLLDIGMPKIDGLDVAAQIRGATEGRRTLLVALTGWGQDKDRAAAMRAGFDHHLTKPVDPDRLFAILRSGDRRNA